MATRSSVAHELNPADERILDLLKEGRATPVWIADELDLTRQYVHQRLALLKAADLVENLGHGLYERTEVDVIEDGGHVPTEDGEFPMECQCGKMLMTAEDAHDHLPDCPEINS